MSWLFDNYPVIAKMADLNIGRQAHRVANTPHRAYDSAAKGSASGSLLAIAAVPKPCAVAAAAMPREIGSLAPTADSIAGLHGRERERERGEGA